MAKGYSDSTVLLLLLFVMINTTMATTSLSQKEKFMIFCGQFEHVGWTFVILMAIIGCVANAFNMIIYRKLGLDESINASFCGIALADFFSCVMGGLYALCQHPQIRDIFLRDLFFILPDIGAEVFYPLVTMGGTASSLMTALMAIQRCLCVAIPLKVKTIFSSTRTKIAMGLVVLYTLATCIPYLVVTRFGWIPQNVTTHDGSTHTTFFFRRLDIPARQAVVDFTTMNHVVVTATANAVIITCTVILWIHLAIQSRWRKRFASDSDSSGKAAASSAPKKETKVVKTVVLICTLYVVCAIPIMAFIIFFMVDPNFKGVTWDIFYYILYRFLFQITVIVQAINISANIFIYYSVSTQFRETFDKTFSFHRCCARSSSRRE